MRISPLLAIFVLSLALLGVLCAPCAADSPTATSIVGAKLAADGTPVSLTGAIITAVSTGLLYVEADDRSSGIYVLIAHSLQAGMRANITGTVQTDTDGERYIAATAATENGSGSIQPVALSNRDLGGSDLPSGVAGGGQKGIPGGVGLNNIGLLVRIRGRVTHAGYNNFYIDDGAGLLDGSGYRGVKVVGSLPLCMEMDPVGWYVEVTGLSTISRSGPNTLCRCVLATDVSLVNEVQKPSGLVYADLRVGTGATASWNSTVSVYYTLWLTDCILVDSNMETGTPFEFTLGQGAAIPGFQEGIVGMKEGGKRFLVVPPELGYGEEGMSDLIPPNAVLLFEVELVSAQ